MRWKRVRLVLLCATLVVLAVVALPKPAEEPPAPKREIRLPEVESLDGTYWAAVNAFPRVRFQEPLAVAAAHDGTDRLFVLERRGKVHVIRNDATVAEKTLVVDFSAKTWFLVGVENGALGLALHPEFGKPGSPHRGYFYVFYTATDGDTHYDRLARYTIPDGADVADPSSETILIDQVDEHRWHNGGSLAFGPDGFLYVSLGDEGGNGEQYKNSQRIDRDFFSGVLRIDVDMRGGDVSHPPRRKPESARTIAHYYVPSDNPWVGRPNVLEEFYALGFRNPHRMTFDPKTGALWLGDVGDANREEVNIVRAGHNYGWAYDEGGSPYKKSRLNGKPANYVGKEAGPIYSYPHTDFNYAVIGGYVYRGEQFPELYGKYVFGDNVSGRVWALETEGGKAVGKTELATISSQALSGLSSFGVDANGEILMVVLGQPSIEGGRIMKLVRAEDILSTLPKQLSETGLFADTKTLAPAPGVVPYEVNTPLWSDGARKRRWIRLPEGEGGITFDAVKPWSFPEGTTFVKHFERGGRRLETRIMIRYEKYGFIAATYKWNDKQTDATILRDELREGGWHYPSRQQCMMCHTGNTGYVLGVNARQLNRDGQLQRMEQNGMFAAPLPADLGPVLVAVDDEAAPLEHRVRSYLDANCSHCHNAGGVMAQFDASFSTPLKDQNLIRGKLYRVIPKSGVEHVVVPRDPQHSGIVYRMSHKDVQMPPIAVSMSDQAAIKTITEWINQLDAE